MLMDLVNMFMGSLPSEFEFLKIFGIICILYVFIQLFNLIYQAILDLIKGL